MKRTLVIGSMALVLLAAPGAASAARAYTAAGAEIFAGPGDDYPVVAQLGQGVAVNVNGCLSDYSWCDVSLGSNRGWVYAGDLTYPYRSRRVLIPDYGPQLGLPLITFSLGTYWDRNYRGRSFYRERAQWEERWRDRPEYRGHDGWNDRERPNWRGSQDARNRPDFRDDQERYRNNEGRAQYRNDQQRAYQERMNQDRANQNRPAQDRANQQQGRVNRDTANQNVIPPPRMEQTAPNYPRENGNESGSR